MAPNASLDGVNSHWCTLIENLQASPLGFYQSIEGALQRRQIPDTKNSRVEYKESGVLSARREYLRVTRERLVFDICGAPFGTGFFVSWWLAEPPPPLNPFVVLGIGLVSVVILNMLMDRVGFLMGLLLFAIGIPIALSAAAALARQGRLSDDFILGVPVLGSLYERFFKPPTYYRIDTTLMFQKAVHNAVLEVIDDITTAKGLRALSESERKPIMREFHQRKAA